jgi:hypothetical protein
LTVESVTLDLSSRKILDECLDRHREAIRFKAVAVVAAVEPYVVMLPEQATPLFGIRDRRILVCALLRFVEGHLEHRPATGYEHAMELAQRLRVVGDMLQDVVANHRIERAVVVLDVRDVEPLHRERRVEIATDVLDPRISGEMPMEGGLGRYVEKAQLPVSRQD